MKYLKNSYFCSDSYVRSWYGLCNHVARTASVLLLLLTLGVGQMWGSGGLEGTTITMYATGDIGWAESTWDDASSVLKIDCRRKGNDGDFNTAGNAILNAEMTNTGYTYNGHAIYSYTFKELYDGAQIRLKHYKSGEFKEDYTAAWEGTSTMNGKIYQGWNGSSHVWADYHRDVTVYAIGSYFGSGSNPEWNNETSTIKIDVRRNGNSWSDAGDKVIWNADMTNTGYNYKGYPIYSYRFLEYYDGAQCRFKHYVSGVHREDYSDDSWRSASAIDGKIYIGWITDHHQWDAYGTDITLDQQSGSGGTSSVTATVGSAMPAITLPTRNGYTFGGYFTAADGAGTKYYNADGSSAANWIKDAAPTTLYAKWYANDYSFAVTEYAATTDKYNIGDIVKSSTGGTMKYTPQDNDANARLYYFRDQYYVRFSYADGNYTAKSRVTVSLAKNMQAGSIITATISHVNADAVRGLKLLNTSGTTKATWTKKAAGTHTYVYEVQAGDGLAGANQFMVQYESGVADLVTLTVANSSSTNNTFTITLNNQEATTAGTASLTDIVYNTSMASNIERPAKTGYMFAGYYTGTGGTGTKLIAANGAWIPSVAGYTDASKNWLYTENITLYAHWVALPAAGPTAPTYQECQVLPIYCQYYTHTLTPNLAWGVGIKTDRTIDGVKMWDLALGPEGYFGFDWGWLPFGVDDYTGLHLDVYTPTAQTLQVVAPNRPAGNYGGNVEAEVSVNTTAGAWTAINIPVSDYTEQGLDMERLYTLKIMGNAGDPMLITNVFFYKTASCPAAPTPVAHSKGIGTAQAQNVPTFQNNNGNLAGTITNDTIDFYVATLNDEIIYKVATTHDHTMWTDGFASPQLYVLNNSNERVTNFAATRNGAFTVGTYEGTIPGSVGETEFDWNMGVHLVGGSHQWNGQALSEKMTYKRGYVNIPNSDETVPTMTSAALKAEAVVGDTTISVTGGADNSGQFFYYFEDEFMGVYHISLSNEFTIPTTTDGCIYNIDCYVVDFNGNMSSKQTVTIAMPYDVNTNLALNRPITIGVGSYATRANDGNTGTRMEGANSDYINQWMYVDLMGYYTLSEIKIYFETACSDNFVLQAAHTLPSPANEDTYWRTIYTNTTTPETGNTGDKVNTYDVSGSTARYVRFKSYHNYDDNAYGFSIYEFEVYGSAVVSKDATAPMVSTASVSAIVNGDELQMTLVASDGSKFFRIIDNDTDEKFLMEADGDNHVVLTNKTYAYCEAYSFDIQAMDDAANLSAVTSITPTVTPPVDYNLATDATATAGTGTASSAVDGSAGTRWSSNGGSDSQHWITVDLQKLYNVSSIKLSWETACPKHYYLNASPDGTNFYPVGHYTTAPSTSNDGSVYTTYTLQSGVEARYLQMVSLENNTGYGTSIFEFEAYGTCASNATKPIMTFAELQEILMSNSGATAHINIGAWDDATAFDDLRYKVVFTAGKSETLNGQKATDGILSLTGLTIGTTYTVQIYVVDGNSNVSDNYKELTITPKMNLYYLTGDGTGAAGAWEGALSTEVSAATRRFSTTSTLGVYSYSINVVGNPQHYRLYYSEDGSITYKSDYWSAADNQQINNHEGETITVYAKDKDHFVSNFDEMYVYGTAVGAAEESGAMQMVNDGSTFVWKGAVTSGSFRIIVKATQGPTAEFTDHSRARIMTAAADFDNAGSWGFATLTFDMATWTSTFEELPNFVIYHHGQAPDGKVETYAGGTIVQPIEYRRKFEKDTWYSIYFPFTVAGVKVIDDEDGTYYDLLPYYRSSDGLLHGKNYIIRKATPATGLPLDKFGERSGEQGWLDPAAENNAGIVGWLPEANTPYMIQFHNDYYTDKWIAFISAPGRTIPTKAEMAQGSAPVGDKVVNVYGNNTLDSTQLTGQTYKLNYEEYGGNAWTRFDAGASIYPFDCFIRANAELTARYRVIRRETGEVEETPTDIVDIYSRSSFVHVYSVTGQFVTTLYDITPDDAGRQLQHRLPEGMYVMRSGQKSYKLIIGGH